MSISSAPLRLLFCGLFLTCLTLASCRKDETVIYTPAACFTADRLEISAGETIHFSDCSQADHVYFRVLAEGDVHTGIVYMFNEDGTYSLTFPEPGIYVATAEAHNEQPGSPITTYEQTITVN